MTCTIICEGCRKVGRLLTFEAIQNCAQRQLAQHLSRYVQYIGLAALAVIERAVSLCVSALLGRYCYRAGVNYTDKWR